MKKNLKAAGLTVALPLTLALSAGAQEYTYEPLEGFRQSAQAVTQEAVVAQTSDDEQAWDAYANSEYSYWDAVVLANFWGQEVGETKTTMGHKLLSGPKAKAMLGLQITDARTKAMGSVDSLSLYSASGYNYEDAQAMAEFWGDPTPWEGKLRIERNLILGNQHTVENVLELSR
jgi:hypothetical protein